MDSELPATRPISPSSASTSRTKVPFPTPPIDGLHESSPTVSSFWVKRIVLAPVRAEPAAASHPACPPPITQTRYSQLKRDIRDVGTLTANHHNKVLVGGSSNAIMTSDCTFSRSDEAY